MCLEKDRGGPEIPECNPYPYTFKTHTLTKGKGLQLVGVQVEWGYQG